ncbi:elongin C [Maublancomyces gigas]|uniref:Elongin-C n=1 Tax=Discina gigas TaxID=1032678 RepID=A0ABR3GEQ3_9PEZI
MAETNSVVLVSNDNFQFVVRKSAATVSPAIKSMLDRRSNFAEARENKIVFQNMNAVILEKVCEYFYYNEKYRDAKDVPDMDIPPELALELLMVADFLHT